MSSYPTSGQIQKSTTSSWSCRSPIAEKHKIAFPSTNIDEEFDTIDTFSSSPCTSSECLDAPPSQHPKLNLHADSFSDDDEFMDEVSSMSFQDLCSSLASFGSSQESYRSVEESSHKSLFTAEPFPQEDDGEFSSCWDSSDSSGDETEESYEDCVDSCGGPDHALVNLENSWEHQRFSLHRRSHKVHCNRICFRHDRRKSHRRMSAFPEDVLKAFRPLDEFALTDEEKRSFKKAERQHNRNFRGPNLVRLSSRSFLKGGGRRNSLSSSSSSSMRRFVQDEAFTDEIWNAWEKSGAGKSK